MTSTNRSSEAEKFTPARSWGLLIWVMFGIAALLASFDLTLALSPKFESIVGLVSIASGILITWTIGANKACRSRLQSVEASPVKRVIALLIMPFFITVLSWANLYVVLHMVHSATAEKAISILAISSKSKARPYREQWTSCKQYLRFKELAWYPGGRYCLPVETFNQIQPGAAVAAVVQKSPIGFTIEDVQIALRAN